MILLIYSLHYGPGGFENLHAVFVPGGNDDNIPALHIDMNAEKLTVSWRYSSKLPDNLKAYVVQYRQFGSRPGQSFDWLKLNGGQTTALFRGLLLMCVEIYLIQCGLLNIATHF